MPGIDPHHRAVPDDLRLGLGAHFSGPHLRGVEGYALKPVRRQSVALRRDERPRRRPRQMLGHARADEDGDDERDGVFRRDAEV